MSDDEQGGDRRAGERQLHRRRPARGPASRARRRRRWRSPPRRTRTTRSRSALPMPKTVDPGDDGTAPRPASTPRSAGSASGLRVTPCITAPARPSAAPTSRPTTVRGTRSARTMRWSLFVGSNSMKASHDRLQRDRLGAVRQRARRHGGEQRRWRRRGPPTGSTPASGRWDAAPPPRRPQSTSSRLPLLVSSPRATCTIVQQP